MNVETFVQRRSARRSRVFMTAMLISAEGACRVTIRDISETGARVGLDCEVPIDSDAVLKRKPIFAAARIVWCRRRQVGLEFYRPLTREELESTFNPASGSRTYGATELRGEE